MLLQTGNKYVVALDKNITVIIEQCTDGAKRDRKYKKYVKYIKISALCASAQRALTFAIFRSSYMKKGVIRRALRGRYQDK